MTRKIMRRKIMVTNKSPIIDTGVATLVAWKMFDFASYFIMGVMGITILFWLHHPWPNAARLLISDTSPIPIVGWLATLPIVGRWFIDLAVRPVVWFSIVLMVIVNMVQVIAMLYHAGYLPNLKGKWPQLLSYAAIGSWFTDLAVAVMDNPIYQGGWAGFIADLPMPTLSFWIGTSILKNIALMFTFECSIVIFALGCLAIKHNKGRSKAQARAKAAK